MGGEISDAPDVKKTSRGETIGSIEGHSSEEDSSTDDETPREALVQKEPSEREASKSSDSAHGMTATSIVEDVHPRVKKLMELADHDSREISQELLEALFLKRYKMSTDELKVLALRMR